MSRVSLSTFLLMLITGLGLGMYVGWVVSPVRYVDTDPASLAETYKDDYILMTATLYSADGDLAAAQTRLATLGFDNPGSAVAEAAQRFINAQRAEAELRRVAGLAAALDAVTPAIQPYLP